MVFLYFFKDFFVEEQRILSSKKPKIFLFLGDLGENSWIIRLLFIEDESLNIPLTVIWNIHCKSLQQKKMDLLTSARGEFGCGRWPKK